MSATLVLYRPVGPEELAPIEESGWSAEFASRYDRRVVGGRQHEELWVPAEELEDFNAHIVGSIEVVVDFRREGEPAKGD